jgi:glutamate carboxypeptidase
MEAVYYSNLLVMTRAERSLLRTAELATLRSAIVCSSHCRYHDWMEPILAHARAQQAKLIGFLKELVECESPSDDPAAVNRFVDLFAQRVSDIARVKAVPGGRYGKHLLCEFQLAGREKEGQILGLGHSDTVWPMGTIRDMPWRQERTRLSGPGVLDMKSGLAFFVFAMRVLHELRVPVRRKVTLLINSDEEVGSASSRPLTEQEARQSLAVLVLEPGSGLDGKLKTGRKGVGTYRVTVHGKASHAGVDFEAGANAVVELAHQIDRIRRFTNLRRGVTVNVGLIQGGTRTNVVPERAAAAIDFRVPKIKDYEILQRNFATLRPRDTRCRVDVKGELNRPPMERTPAVAALFRTASRVAAQIGLELAESETGGGSDGNFTAALGIPTLDGLGGVGEGAHALHECILIDRIADRTALLAGLVASL